MNKKIITVLSHNFSWMKKDFILLLLLIFITAAVLHYIEMDSFFQFILMLIILGKAFAFNASYTILDNSVDQFSWKFLQGLPLSKKELIVSLALSYFVSLIPVIIALACFWPTLNKLYFHDDFIMIKWIINLSFAFMFLGISVIRTTIEFPRVEYQKRNANKKLIRLLRRLLVFSAALFYFMWATHILEEQFDVDVYLKIKMILRTLGMFVSSWWSVPIWMSLVVFNFYKTLRCWNNEKKSYYSNIWKPKKEYTVMGVSISLIIIFILNVDIAIPDRYEGKIQREVFRKNYVNIEKKLKENYDINIVNKYGTTPMLVAIREGNLEMVKFLEKKGAHFEGELGRKKDKVKYDAILLAIYSTNTGMLEYVYSKAKMENDLYKSNGFDPIHYAAMTCKAQMVDYLLQKSSDPNVRNADGETPLLVASRAGCLSAAIALKDAGALFDVKDKNGKDALAIVRADTNYSKYDELRYFIEKNMRKPASIKSSP